MERSTGATQRMGLSLSRRCLGVDDDVASEPSEWVRSAAASVAALGTADGRGGRECRARRLEEVLALVGTGNDECEVQFGLVGMAPESLVKRLNAAQLDVVAIADSHLKGDDDKLPVVLVVDRDGIEGREAGLREVQAGRQGGGGGGDVDRKPRFQLRQPSVVELGDRGCNFCRILVNVRRSLDEREMDDLARQSRERERRFVDKNDRSPGKLNDAAAYTSCAIPCTIGWWMKDRAWRARSASEASSSFLRVSSSKGAEAGMMMDDGYLRVGRGTPGVGISANSWWKPVSWSSSLMPISFASLVNSSMALTSGSGVSGRPEREVTCARLEKTALKRGRPSKRSSRRHSGGRDLCRWDWSTAPRGARTVLPRR